MGRHRRTFIPVWKKFGGKDYQFHESWYNRVDAIRYANKERAKGFTVRIAKVPLYPGDRYPEYRIYRRVGR